MAFLSGYNERVSITISDANVDGNLTDFPIEVAFTSNATIGANIDSGGLNVRFTAVDGTTLLKYERKTFSVSSGNATGRFNVKVPTVSASAGTVIYLYFKGGTGVDGEDKTAVWDSGFAAVYHLEESGDHVGYDYRDSTANGNHGQGGGGTSSAVPTRTTGISGYGQNFDGSNDFISIPDSSSLDLTTLAIEVFFKPSSLPNATAKMLVTKASTSGNPSNWDMYLYGNGSAAAVNLLWYNSTYRLIQLPTYSITVNNWNHIVGVYASGGSTKQFYHQGLPVTTDDYSGNTNLLTNTRPVEIGRRENDVGTLFQGVIDEVRIHNTVRSNAWFKFTYHNLTSVSNELTFGPKETPVSIAAISRQYRQRRVTS